MGRKIGGDSQPPVTIPPQRRRVASLSGSRCLLWALVTSNLGYPYFFVTFVEGGEARDGGDAMDGGALGEAGTLTLVRYFFSGMS